MTKTERIRIELAIIAALASKDWNEVALILDEFGIHELNRDRWEGSIESFTSACLREARDEVLHEMAAPYTRCDSTSTHLKCDCPFVFGQDL